MIENAVITGTSISVADHGLLSAYVHLSGDGWGVCFGGFKLDGPHGNPGEGKNYCAVFLRGVLDALEVEKWEDLEGKSCRVDVEGPGGMCLRIGHFMKDRWFDAKATFDAMKGNGVRVFAEKSGAC